MGIAIAETSGRTGRVLRSALVVGRSGLVNDGGGHPRPRHPTRIGTVPTKKGVAAMPPEIPPGVAVETIYVVEATYAPDAAETRRPHRAEHLARVIELRRAGTLLEAGGFADFSAALLLFRTSSAEEALEICRNDVYTRCGVWVELRARPWGRVVTEEELAAATAS